MTSDRPRHPALALALKIASISVGGTLILLGLVMLFTPGPGWLAILAGLAMLSPHSRMAKWIMLWLKQKLRMHHHEHDEHDEHGQRDQAAQTPARREDKQARP